MTRDEFINEIETVGELKDFCYDNDCDECDDVFSEEDMNDCVDDDLYEYVRHNDWRDTLSFLENIPTYSDTGYYYRDDYGDFCSLDYDDFDDYKDRVLEWCDNNDIWDEPDEDNTEDVVEIEEEPDVPEEDEDDFMLDEGCSLDELFNTCKSDLQIIKSEENQREQASDVAFADLIQVVKVD